MSCVRPDTGRPACTLLKKLALERRHEDHVSMAELYKYALDTTENTPLTPKFVEEIAREEVLENGNWYSFMKENKPSVSILH